MPGTSAGAERLSAKGDATPALRPAVKRLRPCFQPASHALSRAFEPWADENSRNVLSQERHRMIVTEARKQPQQDHAPATIDHDAKIPTRKDRQSLTVTPCEKVVHRPKVNRCPDVVNYPATPTFSISAYKIYAVHRMKKYK